MKANELYEKRNDFFLSMSTGMRGGIILFIVLGVASFIAGIASGEMTRTWGAFLFNLMFFYAIALAGIAFGNMQDVIGASWARPIKRLHESFGSFLPIGTGLLILFLLMIKFRVAGAGEVYKWIADPHMLDHFWGKNVWLQENFMILRNIGALAVILLLAMWHLRSTAKRDIMFLQGDRSKAEQYGKSLQKSLRHWSAPILVVYGVCFSLIVFDLTMSLSPLWFSTLWGGWSFALMMHTFLALLLIAMFFLKDSPLGKVYTRQQFHDVGKLMHGFTAFFAYLTYAHILTYWYANMPETTEYFIHRLHEPWIYLVVALPFLNFLLPFFILIPKASKWSAPVAIPVSILILFAQWNTYMLVVQPEVMKAEDFTVPWIEVGLFLGFFGLFLLTIFQFGKKTPMLGLADPLLSDSLKAGHH